MNETENGRKRDQLRALRAVFEISRLRCFFLRRLTPLGPGHRRHRQADGLFMVAGLYVVIVFSGDESTNFESWDSI